MTNPAPQLLYQGSVKNLMASASPGALVFDYTDAYSVFDWGRMPDALSRKGEALAVLASDLFERLERAEAWKEFSRSEAALGLRRGNRFGSNFMELGERLQREGLRTHYLGALRNAADASPVSISECAGPVRAFSVRGVSAERPKPARLLGREIYDYQQTRATRPPRLVPLEVVFRFSVPPGSSILSRAAEDPAYLASLGYGDLKISEGVKWDFPVLELFTKLESSDRLLSLSEGLAIGGISGEAMQDLLLKTAWIAGFLKWRCANAGVELADGKLEWAIDEAGAVFLVDAVGPDELRLLKDGVQLSKEFLRLHYRGSRWFQAIEKAKASAKSQGVSDWKKLVLEQPQPLPPAYREAATQLYLALTNSLTGKAWFPDAWPLERVVDAIQRL